MSKCERYKNSNAQTQIQRMCHNYNHFRLSDWAKKSAQQWKCPEGKTRLYRVTYASAVQTLHEIAKTRTRLDTGYWPECVWVHSFTIAKTAGTTPNTQMGKKRLSKYRWHRTEQLALLNLVCQHFARGHGTSFGRRAQTRLRQIRNFTRCAQFYLRSTMRSVKVAQMRNSERLCAIYI